MAAMAALGLFYHLDGVKGLACVGTGMCSRQIDCRDPRKRTGEPSWWVAPAYSLLCSRLVTYLNLSNSSLSTQRFEADKLYNFETAKNCRCRTYSTTGCLVFSDSRPRSLAAAPTDGSGPQRIRYRIQGPSKRRMQREYHRTNKLSGSVRSLDVPIRKTALATCIGRLRYAVPA